MLLVLAPFTHAAREYRLANLLRTGCLDRALGLVEAQALVLKGQIAVVQDTGNLAFEVGHRLFVVHIKHFAWQNFMPVIHRQAVFPVVIGQFENVVCQRLAATE